MNVLSLFDGMSCGMIALERAGFEITNYYSSEIDKFAIKVSQDNYPSIERLGDVTNWENWDIDFSKIDLVLAGFPCQAWSLAGNQLGDKDERGKLFWVMLDIINKVISKNPKAKFIIENVKMKKEFEEYITHHTTNALGNVTKTLINSALVSAQNRQRYYWTNFEVIQPEDKGIVLSDIIEDVNNWESDRDKSHCIDANYFKGTNVEQYHKKKRRQIVFKTGICNLIPKKKDSLCHQVAIATDIKGNESIKRVYDTSGKCPTLTTMGGGHREPKIVACGAFRGRYISEGLTIQQFEKRKDNKTNALTTVQKDNVIEEATYRKLTPLECERLQTVPENYTKSVSNTQRYKMLGNGWTVDVISHILNCMGK